jgi:hypothetical protein
VLELYDQIVELKAELNNERAEKNTQEMYLNRVLKEIEAKTPQIRKQKDDYHRALRVYNKMEEQLEQAKKERDTATANWRGVEREREELVDRQRIADQQVKDLSRQVQLLLKAQVERARGRPLLTGGPAPLALPPSTTGAGAGAEAGAVAVLSEELVTFTDIQQLQTRNTQLLLTVHKLQEKQRRWEAVVHGHPAAPDAQHAAAAHGAQAAGEAAALGGGAGAGPRRQPRGDRPAARGGAPPAGEPRAHGADGPDHRPAARHVPRPAPPGGWVPCRAA